MSYIHMQRASTLCWQEKNGEWYVLEDNLRIPSGASYPLITQHTGL